MKGSIHSVLNRDMSKYNKKVLLIFCFVFVLLVGIVFYAIASNQSYALFTDEIEGQKTIVIYYEEELQKTVLYTDGTLIINEKKSNHSTNVQTHGAVLKEYFGMKSEGTDVEKYIFTSETQVPWYNDRNSITKVEIGQTIEPTSTAFWFYELQNMTIGDFTNLDTSSVTDMSNMFYQAGYNATTWRIGDLSNWNTSSVTNMSNMFYQTGYNATTWESIGVLKVYATNIYRVFYQCPGAKATINIYSNPASGTSGYDQAFTNAATISGSLITVNYSSVTTNIDNIIATKSSTSNVVKGSVIS